MTNIWADLYKEIREPFFEMADPYAVTEEKKEKPKRWWDDDGDGIGYEKGEVSSKFKKKKAKVEEEVEEVDEAREHDEPGEGPKQKYGDMRGLDRSGPPTSFGGKWQSKERKAAGAAALAKLNKEERDLFTKTDKNERIDVRKNIKNKIDTKPSIPEEVEEWVGVLLDEGYDLSQFTWQEVVDIYESADLEEADTTMLAPRGDLQNTKTAGADPLQAAKRRAAQAQVRKELSDLQVAKARASAKLNPASEEAVLNYLDNRYDLSEGVFDPKKSKLRPASERKSTELSPAQKKAAEMKQKRAERLEQEAEKVLRQVKGGGSTRRSSKPMGSESPAAKAPAPEANRQLSRREKQDTLAKKAGDVLKSLKK
jgi:hypothetical protein